MCAAAAMMTAGQQSLRREQHSILLYRQLGMPENERHLRMSLQRKEINWYF